MPEAQRRSLHHATETQRYGENPWRSTIVAICILTASPAFATVLLPADLPTAVAESNVIVYGRVVDVRSAVTVPPRGIETFVTVAVIDALKGNPGRSVTFRVPNGQVGRYRRIVVGAPEFEEGDEVVVFLHGQPPAIPALFGLSQGVYRVARQAGVPVVMRGSSTRRPLALDAFAREIETIVEKPR